VFVCVCMHARVYVCMYECMHVSRYVSKSNHQQAQCVAVCCSVLRCVAVCCSVLQCVAVCCGVCMNACMYRGM